MKFDKLTLGDKEIIRKYLAGGDITWEYNFATLYLWDVKGELMRCEDDGVLYMYNTFDHGITFLPPYTTDKARLAEAMDKIALFARSTDTRCIVRGLTKEQADGLDSGRFSVTTDRNEYDYIYRSDDLKYLRGKAYHSKRNFVTRFASSYEYEFREYEDADFEGIMALYDMWEVDASHPTLSIERAAIVRALKLWRELDLHVSVLKANGEYAAFSVVSFEPNGVVHCLFEKGEVSYTGIYPAINKFTAEKLFPDGALVNRQEDMGLEGLRKSKLSYSPCILAEKYAAEILR